MITLLEKVRSNIITTTLVSNTVLHKKLIIKFVRQRHKYSFPILVILEKYQNQQTNKAKVYISKWDAKMSVSASKVRHFIDVKRKKQHLAQFSSNFAQIFTKNTPINESIHFKFNLKKKKFYIIFILTGLRDTTFMTSLLPQE